MRRHIVPVSILILLGLILRIELLAVEYILIALFLIFFMSLNYISLIIHDRKTCLKYGFIGFVLIFSSYLFGLIYPFYPTEIPDIDQIKEIKGEVIEVYNLGVEKKGIILVDYKGCDVKIFFNMYKKGGNLYNNKDWIYRNRVVGSKRKITKQNSVNIRKGDIIHIKGEIYSIKDPTNPKMFNVRKFYLSKGIKYGISGCSSDIKILGNKGGILRSLDSHKIKYQNFLKRKLSNKNYQFLNAMLFGETKYINTEALRIYRKSGIGHLMAVSGIHIGVLYLFISFIYPFRKRYAFFLFVMIVLLIYGYFSNFSPSVVRAIIMVGEHIVSKIKFRRYDLLSAALFASLLISIYNPLVLFNIGFKLSFLAIFLISSLQLLFKHRKFPNIKLIFSIQILMLPATVYYFNYISLIGFIINPIISIAVTFLIIVNFILFLIFTFFNIRILFLFDLMDGFLSLIDSICESFTVNNFMVFDFPSPNIFFVLLIYFLYFFFSSEQFLILIYQKYHKKIIMILLISLITFTYLFKTSEDGDYIRFLDIGQGDGIHIKTEDDFNVLIDGGGSFRNDLGQNFLKPYFLKNGISKIDIGIVTHMDLDHYGSLFTLARSGMIDDIVLPASYAKDVDDIMRFSQLSRSKIHFLHTGNVIKLKGGDLLKVIYSGELYSQGMSENYRALVLEGFINGNKILFTSDIDKSIEKHILDNYEIKNIDILKVAHHGSKYSTSDQFLNAVKPKYAIIQVGKNNFGHPSQDIIEKITNNGIILLRNDKDGCISVKDHSDYSSILDMKGNIWHLKKRLD